ncbi:biotin carboxylase N-terminal domain-containing protein [Cupriavidus basilensis]
MARQAKADAIHPGYGFRGSPDFAQAVMDAGIRWIGPSPEVMRKLGNQLRRLAMRRSRSRRVPVMPATDPLPHDLGECKRLAAGIGYPLMLKGESGAVAGAACACRRTSRISRPRRAGRARREALKAAFGNDEVYVEELVRNART